MTLPQRAFVEQIMGMPVSVHLRGPDPGSAGALAAAAEVFSRLRLADRVFSTYRDDSDLSRLTRGELTVAQCHPDVAQVAALCEVARERTDGWFEANLPGVDGVRRWDPTGLVKGWAVQRAAQVLDDLPGHDHCVNAGGDVTVGRKRDDTPPWRVGIQDPRDGSRLVDVAEVSSGAVATSGTAARGAHILDPFSSRPVTDLLSVTVTGPSLLWADVDATAAFARGADAVAWLTAQPDSSALVVHPDGEVTRVRWVRCVEVR